MENSADVQENLPEQGSSDRFGGSGEEAIVDDSLSGASTEAYESNEEMEDYISDDDADGTESEGPRLEDIMGEEAAQCLRQMMVRIRELRTNMLREQKLLNRVRTYLVRHGYGRNTCNREDHYYSLFLKFQTGHERNKEFMRTVLFKLDGIRNVLALHGVELEEVSFDL